MQTYSGLYYPFIHFKNDNWLKFSALYWDKMARIVPNGYATQDSDTVRKLGDFVETVRPDWVRPQFGETFAEFVGTYAGALRARYGVDQSESWPIRPESQRPPHAGGPSGQNPRLGYVFFEKMTDQLRTAFIESGIARFDSPDDRQWLGMHPDLAFVYMTAMADQIAGERGLAPIADNSVDHIAASGCTVERLAQALLQDVELVDRRANSREVEMSAALIAIETVVPRNLAQLPVEKILEFRHMYAEERAEFQGWILSFVNDRQWLGDIQDPRAVRDRVESEYEKHLKPKLRSVREALRAVGIETVRSCMNVKALLPPMVPKVAAAMGVGLEPVTATAAAIVWSVVPILQDKRKALRQYLKTSQVAYLLRAEEELNPMSLMDEVKLGLRKFCLGV
jgi:Family of unknown function (DUF6236)